MRIKGSAKPTNLNSFAERIPQFCILHFAFCIKKAEGNPSAFLDFELGLAGVVDVQVVVGKLGDAATTGCAA